MDSQHGWRRCNVCQGIFWQDSPGLSCIGGAMHVWPTSAEYNAPWGDVQPGCQPGWARCTTCGGLVFRPGVGVCSDGAPHTFDEFDASYNVPFQEQPGIAMQAGWRWCQKCQRLWHADHPPGQCFAGGTHDATGSGAYLLPRADLGLEQWWAWCSTCQGVVRFGKDGCAAGGQHTTSTGYVVAYGGGTAHDQPGWRYCSRCHGLVFETEGVCFLGGPHEFADSLPYHLPVDVEPPDAQPGWRLCSACQTLSYTGFAIGPCPAGGTHDVTSSGHYSLWPSSLDFGEPGWRACQRCRSLVLVSVSLGACRDGSPHDVSQSPAYQPMSGGVPDGGQGSLAWCHRCQALVHGGPSATGVCFDGVPHDITQSGVYGVPRNSPPEGAEAGWRICSRCAQVVLPDAQAGPGTCTGGVGHDLTGSPELFMVRQAPPVPEMAVPALALGESDLGVVVEGTGFPASAAVVVSVIVSGVTTGHPVPADAGGAFRLELSPVVPAPAGGGLVIARTPPDVVATGRLKTFVPAP